MSAAPDEFALIAELFAPLSVGAPGALGLGDDVARLDIPAGCEVVVTTDTLVAGVHFFADDPAALIACKLVRVNLSDLAAKGARPFAVLLAAAFPRGVDMTWLRAFAAGLGDDLGAGGIALIGGDTVATPGPLTLTLTAFGAVAPGQALLRRGAAVGDLIWVSGTIGDAALGLRVRRGELPGLEPAAAAFLRQRYLLPSPRLALGPALVGLASAAMDVSDGLVQDLGHLCRQSGVAARLEAARVPLSAPARQVVGHDQSALACILGGGDDYEILFTAPPEHAEALHHLTRRIGVPLTEIGRIEAGQGVTVLDGDGRPLTLAAEGWRHFGGGVGPSGVAPSKGTD